MRWLVMTLLVASSCANQQPRSSPPQPGVPLTKRAPFFDPLGRYGMMATAISGRVLLDGQPVTYFGVTLAPDATFMPGLGTFHRPKAVRSDDGLFRIELTDSRNHDLVIAGPGFKRHVIRSADMKSLSLGDIAVSSSNKIEGTVRDERGMPVPNVRVMFSPSPGTASRDITDELTQLLVGNISVVTDVHGRYEIRGAAPTVPWSRYPRKIDGPMQIRAWSSDSRSSLAYQVPNGDADIDITIIPTGTIEVSAGGRSNDLFIVRPAGADPNMITFSRLRSNRFDDLPVGDYDVMKLSHYFSESGRQRVSVKANAVTSVTLDP